MSDFGLRVIYTRSALTMSFAWSEKISLQLTLSSFNLSYVWSWIMALVNLKIV